MNRLIRILRTQVRRKAIAAELQGTSKKTLLTVPQLTMMVQEHLAHGNKVQISSALMNASGENIVHLSIECDAGLKAAFTKENNDFSKIDEAYFLHALDVRAEELDLDEIDEVQSVYFEESDFKFVDKKLTKMLGYFVDKMDRTFAVAVVFETQMHTERNPPQTFDVQAQQTHRDTHKQKDKDTGRRAQSRWK